MSGKLIPGGRFRHKVIEFLTKKPYRDHMRAPKNLAPRSTPQPVFPASENSAMSANYYYDRDTRRNMGPPVSLLTKKIEAGAVERLVAFFNHNIMCA